jgi:hypothetical protein
LDSFLANGYTDDVASESWREGSTVDANAAYEIIPFISN